MIRNIFWKEWRENRWKYATLWLVLNAPLLMLALLIGLVPGSRAPFADLRDQTVMKYLPLALGESFLVTYIFLLATAFVAVATFRPEEAMFFVFEQSVPRRRYAAVKLLNGAAHVAAAVCVAILLAPAAVYGMMLLSGKVTIAGSAAAFGEVMRAAARATFWCALVSVAAFAGATLISALSARWWLAAVCAIVFIVGFGSLVHSDNKWFGEDNFFEITPSPEGKTLSVSVNFPKAEWLTVSDILPLAPWFGKWKPLPVLSTSLILAVFSAGVALVYQRKELK